MYRTSSLLLVTMLGACGSDPPTNTVDVTAQLALDQPQQLQLGDAGTHTFTLLQHRADRAIVKIESEPQTWAFMPGVPLQIDLNGEGGPEVVAEVAINDDGTVTMHILDIISAQGMAGGGTPPPDPWTLPANPEPAGTVLQRLTIVGQTTTPTALYDFMPVKDSCDLTDPTLYDNYVAETGGKTRILHMAVSSRGYPYFEIGTQEQRPRLGACANGGMLPIHITELMLDEKRPVDLDGNGAPDVDGLLRQVSFAGGMPTLTVVMYARQ